MSTTTKLLILFLSLIILGGTGVVIAYDRIVEVLPHSVQIHMPHLSPTQAPLPTADTRQMIVASTVQIPGEQKTLLPTPTLIATSTPQATATLPPPPTWTPSAAEATAEPVATTTPLPTETPIPTEIPSPTPLPTPTLAPLPSSSRLQNIKNVPQTFNNCGPTNLSIVLNYYGDPITPQQASAFLKPNPNDRNVSPWQITDYVNEQTNLKSTVHSGGTIELMKRFIAAGFPPVIERGMDFHDGEGWYGHYLTLVGFDDATQQFNAMNTYAIPWAPDGEFYSYDELATVWKDFNYTFYVVYPAEQEVMVHAILGETYLDETKMWQNALEIAQKEVDADPQDKFAWFDLGTNYTELGRTLGEMSYYEEGAKAFDKARTFDLPYRMLWYQHRPYMAYYKVGRFNDVIVLADATLQTEGGRNVEEGYLWKGHALAALGQPDAAKVAYQQALDINKEFYPAQWALDYLNQ